MDAIIDELESQIELFKGVKNNDKSLYYHGLVAGFQYAKLLVIAYIAAQSPDLTAVTPANGEALPCAGCTDMDCDGCDVAP